MNFEESRLRTFNKWPPNACVDSRKIAKAGFYYTGQGQEVQCFSCGGRISDWNYGDRVVAVITRHKMLDPGCAFIRDPQASGNVPLSSFSTGNPSESSQSSRVSGSSPDSTRVSESSPDSSSRASESSAGDSGRSSQSAGCFDQGWKCGERLQSESARLETFARWPLSYISPMLLAKAGFYYTGQVDKVECYICEGTVEGWEEGDCPLEEHRRHYPTCPFLVSNNGVHIRNSHSSNLKGDYEGLKGLGVHKHRVPRSPKYSTYEARMRSFKNWPPSIPQTPQQLADAGFYFTGRGDQVRCFHCDGGLRLWEAGDLPWDEHARWFSDCGFLFLVRGQQFIDQTLNSLRCHPSAMKVEGRGVKRKQQTQPERIRTLTEEELQAAMNSPQALAALEVGLEVYRVKLALKQRLETVGQPFARTEDLIGAAFTIQTEEDDAGFRSTDDEDTWGTPPNSPAVMSSGGKSRISPRRDCLRQCSNNGSPGSRTGGRNSTRPSPDTSRLSPSTPSSSGSPRRKSESPSQLLEESRPQTGNSTVSPDKSLSSLEEELRRLKEWRQCKVCMDREVGVVLLPCGHLVTCALCTHSLSDCPLCRQLIQATVRTFLS